MMPAGNLSRWIVFIVAIYYFLVFMFCAFTLAEIKINNRKLRVLTVYKVCPVIVTTGLPEYTSGVGGTSFMVIRLADGYWDDYATLTHELEHAKQCYRGLILFDQLRWCFSPKYRILSERDAFIAEDPSLGTEAGLKFLVAALSSDYSQGFASDEIRELITKNPI